MPDKNRTYLQALKIDKSDKWLEDNVIDAFNHLNENLPTYTNLTFETIAENFPPIVLVMITTEPTQHIISLVFQNSFTLGYLKGLVTGEDKLREEIRLEGLLKEDKPDGGKGRS